MKFSCLELQRRKEHVVYVDDGRAIVATNI